MGGKWFNWLQNRNIPYVIRLKENYNVITGGGRTVEVKNLFRNLKIQQERNLGNKKICGAWHNLSAVRLPKEVEPIRLKKHGRRERSIFGRGLDELMSLFMGSSCMLRHLSLIVFGILQRGLMIT